MSKVKLLHEFESQEAQRNEQADWVKWNKAEGKRRDKSEPGEEKGFYDVRLRLIKVNERETRKKHFREEKIGDVEVKWHDGIELMIGSIRGRESAQEGVNA